MRVAILLLQNIQEMFSHTHQIDLNHQITHRQCKTPFTKIVIKAIKLGLF